MSNNVICPRSEYPRPNLVRDGWLCLNGEWDFEFDDAVSGFEREFYKNGEFTKKINVPFCPESELSGIGDKDFHNCVWYRKTINITKEQLENSSMAAMLNARAFRLLFTGLLIPMILFFIIS